MKYEIWNDWDKKYEIWNDWDKKKRHQGEKIKVGTSLPCNLKFET